MVQEKETLAWVAELRNALDEVAESTNGKTDIVS